MEWKTHSVVQAEMKVLCSEDGGELHREVAGLGTDGGGARERKPGRGSPRSGSWAVEHRLSQEGKHVWESEGSSVTLSMRGQ